MVISSDPIAGIVENHVSARDGYVIVEDVASVFYKGTGLGRKLMSKMIEYCRSRGTRRLTGQVLCRNQAMLAMSRALGFRRKIAPDDTEVFETWLDLHKE